MWRRLLLAALIAIGSEAFTPAPIRFEGSHAQKLLLAPRGWGSRNLAYRRPLFLPEKLALWDAREQLSANHVPEFSVKPDHSISWDALDWCLEAGGESGNDVRINECNGGLAQKWSVVPNSRGQNMIQLQGSSKCLEAHEMPGGFNGAPIQLRECEDKKTEAWTFEEPLPVPSQGSAASLRYGVLSAIALIMLGSISVSMLALALNASLWYYQNKARATLAMSQRGVPACVEEGGVSLIEPLAMRQDGMLSSTVAERMISAVMAISPLDEKDVTSNHTSPEATVHKKTHTMAGRPSTRARLERLSQSLRRAMPKMSGTTTKKNFPIDITLFTCISLWYLGNYRFNIANKLALNAAGGAAGFPLTIATAQLGVGSIYALFLWLAPDARERPKITFDDFKKTLPVGFTSAGAHAATVFALSAGAVSFAQIVKAAEPAVAAMLGTAFYGATVSKAKWLSLIPVIGGVCLASLGELNFAWAALATAMMANVFASIRSNENKKLLTTEGLKDRIGSVGNQYAITTINSFLCLLPLAFLLEGRKFGTFLSMASVNPVILWNVIGSGLWFYLYNELSTVVISKTNAVTMSVCNTAKRVIVIVCVALVMGESLGFLKLLGCSIGIGGVFLYSIIDKLVAKFQAQRG